MGSIKSSSESNTTFMLSLGVLHGVIFRIAPTFDIACILDVAHCRGVHDVAHDEALDGLVLGHQHAALLAAHAAHMAVRARRLVAPAVPALLRHGACMHLALRNLAE